MHAFDSSIHIYMNGLFNLSQKRISEVASNLAARSDQMRSDVYLTLDAGLLNPHSHAPIKLLGEADPYSYQTAVNHDIFIMLAYT